MDSFIIFGGLILEIIGVFSFSISIKEVKFKIEDTDVKVLAPDTVEEAEKWNKDLEKRRRIRYLGALHLGLGFVLQVIGTII